MQFKLLLLSLSLNLLASTPVSGMISELEEEIRDAINDTDEAWAKEISDQAITDFVNLYEGVSLDSKIEIDRVVTYFLLQKEPTKKFKINRRIDEFQGNILVVGSGWSNDYLEEPTTYDVDAVRREFYPGFKENNYRIDVAQGKEIEPDLQGSIMSVEEIEMIPDDRFETVYLERLPSWVLLSPNTWINLNRIVRPGGKIYFTVPRGARKFFYNIIKNRFIFPNTCLRDIEESRYIYKNVLQKQ